MAAYLQRYVDHFDLPVRSGVTVQRLRGCRGDFTLETSAGRVAARQVVVASGPFRRPYVPEAAAGLSPDVHQLHSMDYRRPEDIPLGPVLVVGGGNSAAQLALELAATHDVTVASPGPPWFLPEDVLGVSMYWWSLLSDVLNARSTSWVSRYIRRRGDAIVGRQLREQVERDRWPRCCGARAFAPTPTGCRSPVRWTRPGRRCTTGAGHRWKGCTGWGCRGRPG
jgi:putative flavoprotein involved in K+ transport